MQRRTWHDAVLGVHGRGLPPPAFCAGTVCMVLLAGDPEGRGGHVNCCPPAMEGSPEERVRFGQLERP